MHFIPFAMAALACTASAQMSLTQALNSTSDLSALNTLLGNYPQLAATLAGLTNITLLAPNNAAINAFANSSAGAAALSSDQQLVQGLLTYHVLNGTYASFSNTSSFLHTALQPPTYTNVTSGQVVEARASGNSTTFYSGLKANASSVNSTMNFTGGVIHIINSVLTLPLNISTTAIDFNLTSAVGALNATMLVNAVDTLTDVTVFIPNNAAFQRIGSALPNLTMQQITSILEYHVVNGTVGYSSLLGNTSLPTLQGTNVTITVHNSSSIYVNAARVVIPDVLVANGVVHVIDNVLNPGNATQTANPSESTAPPAFGGASSASDVPYTSGVPTPTSTIATGEIQATATGSSSSSKGGAWVPRPTGMGAALLGGAAVMLVL